MPKLIPLVLISALALMSVSAAEARSDTQFSVQGSNLYMNGDIDSGTLKLFNQV